MNQERAGPLSWLRRIAGKLLPPATPQPEDREAIWSIRRKDARTFFRLLSLLWLAGIAYTGYRVWQQPALEWRHPATAPADTWWELAGDFALAALTEFGMAAVGIAILAMLVTRPLNLTGEMLMSLYQAMVNRFVTPVIEAHEARGRAEGLAEGRVESNLRWREWNRRRIAAAAKGLPFDEPPPDDDSPDYQEAT